jgi:hypothetical protein
VELEFWAQGFVLTKLVLPKKASTVWATPPVHSADYFEDYFAIYLPNWNPPNFPISASQVARITGVSHQPLARKQHFKVTASEFLLNDHIGCITKASWVCHLLPRGLDNERLPGYLQIHWSCWACQAR